MNKELILHNFPELDSSNRFYRKSQRNPISSSSIILPADKFQRDRIPTARKKKVRPKIQEYPPQVEINQVLTPRDEMNHLPVENSFIEVSQAIGPSYVVPFSQLPEQRGGGSFIKVDSEHYLSHKKRQEVIEASSNNYQEEQVSLKPSQKYNQNEDTPAQSTTEIFTGQKNSLSLSTSEATSESPNKEFVLTNPKLISLASKITERKGQSEGRRESYFKRQKKSGQRKSPAQLIQQMESQIQDVVKPLLQRNKDILGRIPSDSETSNSGNKKDAEVSTMTLQNLEEVKLHGTTQGERRLLRSSPDLRYLRKTKTILQKTKKIDFFQNAKSQTIIKYEAPIIYKQSQEEPERYQSYKKKQEQKIVNFLFEKRDRGFSEKALHQSFRRDTHWLVPTLSRQYQEHQEALKGEYGLSARGLGKKKEIRGENGKGGIIRLQTKQEFAQSLDKRQAVVESLRQRMLARRQGTRDK